jgi:predicted metal-dependent phosphotriesterase family hydrolase
VLWVEAEHPLISREDRLKANPYGYLYMKKAVFPQLLEMGVSQKAIDRLCVVGPRKFLEGA